MTETSSTAVAPAAALTREEKLALLARLARERQRLERTFPLSFLQQRLWFLARMDPDSHVNNVFRSLAWKGPLDADALARALSEVVRRHEALRTRYPEIAGEARQQVMAPAPVPLPLEDLSTVPEASRVPTAKALAEVEARLPFDLERGPVLRARLLRLGDDDHVLLLCFHHIATDGWSLGVFFEELIAAYRAYTTGETLNLPEPALQYPDFAVWQRERLSGDYLEGELAWWKEHLDGYPDYLELPTDRPRPAGGSFAGGIVPFAVEPELGGRLHALARAEGATPFQVLLALFEILLYRYSEQASFLVGTNVAGRPRTELERVIGFFAEYLVLAARLRSRQSFRKLLAQVREDALAAQSHQELPFDRLVDVLQPGRNLAHNPLFQVLFLLQNLPTGNVELPGGIALSHLPIERGLAKLDLSLEMYERGAAGEGGFSGYFEYNSDLFDRATAERMAAQFQRLLAAAIADPEQTVGELPLLSPAERETVLAVWNPRYSGAPPLVPDLVRAQAERDPQAPAILFGDHVMSYGELVARSTQLARELRRRGIDLDQPVGVCLERSLAMPMALLGVLESGAAWVPLDPAYPPERIATIVEDTRMKVLVTTSDLLAVLPPMAAEILCLDRDLPPLPTEGVPLRNWPLHPQGLAYVIYTSGSTGKPKGVGVPHYALANHATACAHRYALGPADRALQFTSISFDITSEEIFPTWITGGAVVPRQPGLFPSFEELHAMIERYGLTIVNLPTAYWHEWVGELGRRDHRPPKPLRAVVVGTEQALPERAADWLRLAPDVTWWNGYASTEATVTALVYEPTQADAAALRSALRVPVGKPITNCAVYVLDARMEPVPIGVPGDVYIGGPNVSRGYLGWPSRTAASFLPDPFGAALGYGPGARLYRQGDRGRYLADGTVECLGRSDFQVKIRGFRIEPGEIEACLARHPAVLECVVLPHEESRGLRRLVGYVGLEPGHSASGEELRAFLRETLPEHMVPAAIVTLPVLPLNVNGKVDRRALVRLAPSLIAAEGGEHAAPRTPQEEIVAGIWSELLGREQIGVEDVFFDLGGHSLLATQLVARLRETFEVELALRLVFERPTVAGLAAAIEEAQRAERGLEAPPIAVLPRVREGESTLPCSFAQQRLWVLDRLMPGSPAYNMPFALRLEGPLDEPALVRALGELVRRHETLRTRLVAVDGAPVQRVAPPAPPALERLDLAAEAEPKVAAVAWMRAESARPFDLGAGPLARFVLARLGEDDHLLVATLHHVITDGWSVGVFLRELAVLYTAFHHGEPSPLPELPVQYGDFAGWQRDWLEQGVLAQQLAVWSARLAGAPVLLELPLDRPRPPVATAHGARVPLRVPAELTQALRQLARKERATLFMVLVAGYQALLARWARQPDVLVGTPLAGRTRRELEGVIGFFANTLVLRGQLAAETGFGALVAQARERSLEAFANQDLPFERLVEVLQPERHLSHNPIFQVLFNLHHAGDGALSMPELTLSQPTVDNGTARLDLWLSLAEAGEGLAGVLEHNTDLFDAATAERMGRHFVALLAAAVAVPEQPLAALPWLTTEERAELAGLAAGRSLALSAGTVVESLARVTAERGESLALVTDRGERWTYRELTARAEALARALQAEGVQPGALVAVYLERSADLVATLLAIWQAGAAYLPLDPVHPRERHGWVLADSGAVLLVTSAALEAPQPSDGRALPRLLVDSGLPEVPATAPLPGAVPEGLAYVLYTSGSTGRPKGVAVGHRGLASFVASMREEPGCGPDDVLLALTTVAFDIAGLELWLPLSVGGRVVLAGKETASSPSAIAALLEGEGCTRLQATPATWRMLLGAGWTGKADLVALCGGEALPGELAARLVGKVARLWNVYGPTETTIWSAVRAVDDGGVSVVPIGRPIANTTAFVLDERFGPVPRGVVGELFLGGVGLAHGYLGRPGLTAERFVPDPFSGSSLGGDPGGRLYRTGDLVRWRNGADGELEFLGRRDFQVKLRGFRIELGEIEAALERLPSVRQAVVGLAEPVPGDPRLVAWIVPAGEEAPKVAELREALGRELPEYMVPGVYVPMAALPLNASGKVDRKALPAPDAGARPESPFVAPQGAVEEGVAAIWAQVLGLPRLSTQDNFFELGGHSLAATQVLSRIQQQFGLELSLRTFFDAPTVAALAQALFEQEVQQADAALLAELLADLEQDR